MNRLKHYCSSFILLFGLPLIILAQNKPIEISMIDTMAYTSINTTHIPDARYSVANLIDGKLNTCWVSRLGPEFNPPAAYIAIPGYLSVAPELTLYSGYWKNAKLYEQNSRPKKIKLTTFIAFVPDGFVSENSYLSFAYQLPEESVIKLVDSMQVQSFKLAGHAFPDERLDSLTRLFSREMARPILKTVKIIKLEILEAYAGSRYSDICISEAYFNDGFISYESQARPLVQEVYVNKDENVLLMDTDSRKGIPVYEAKDKIVQLLETSADLHWAIIVTMPAEVEGRAESTYELIDLIAGEPVTANLLDQFPDLSSGTAMYFEENMGQLFVLQKQFDQEIKVALREIR